MIVVVDLLSQPEVSGVVLNTAGACGDTARNTSSIGARRLCSIRVNVRSQSGSSTFERRFTEFRDASGSWTFEIREYQDDLNSIVPTAISSTPDSHEAYRTAVFLEGFILKHKAAGNWSDDVLGEFDSFGSTAEVEAVAQALREIGASGGQ
jgi:hypothetical protein